MKSTLFFLAGFVALSSALPTDSTKRSEIVTRQTLPCLGPECADRNDLDNGTCGDIVYIFARGSTEPANLGFLGTPLGGNLTGGSVSQQGVNYAAGLLTNLDAGGADPAGVTDAVNQFNLANTQCPDAIIVGGGYSQGAAIMHLAIPQLSSGIIDKIAGLVLFGDTQYQQDKMSISDYPPSKLKIYCDPLDGVCDGTLLVTPGHLSYGVDVPGAADFLNGQIASAKAKKL